MDADAQAIPAGMKQAELIFWRSPDSRTDWKIIPPADVPDWLKTNPDAIAKLVAGDMVMDPTKSLWWYRAEPTPSAQEVARVHGNAKRHAEIAARKQRRRAH